MDVRNDGAGLDRQLRAATSPWDRLPLLIELARDPGDLDPGYAHRCAVEALTLARKLNDPFWIAAGLLAFGIDLLPTSRYSEILYYLEQASISFERLDDSRMKAQADFYIAKTYVATRELAKALAPLTRALHVFQCTGTSDWTARAMALFGDIHSTLGDHGKAIERFNAAIAVASESGHHRLLGKFYQHLALAYRRMEDSPNRERYLFKALAAQRAAGDKGGIAVAMGNLANLYIDRKKFSEAELYVRESAELYRQLGYIAQEAISWGRMAYLYGTRKDFAEAFRCYRIGLALCRKCEDKLTLGKLYETLGVLCYKTGRRAHCLVYFLKTLAVLEEVGDRFYLYQIHRLLGHLYEEMGDATSALRHFKEFDRLREEETAVAKYMETCFVEAQNELHELTELMKAEEVRKSTLKQEIQEKETHLFALTLQLLHREESTNKESQQKSDKPDRNRNATPTESWDLFARQFHKVHHNFYSNLARRCPDLTPTEMKVCSLIKVGLSTKEIAEILSVSKRTVDNHRARIHKKMALPQGSSLSGFITQIVDSR